MCEPIIVRARIKANGLVFFVIETCMFLLSSFVYLQYIGSICKEMHFINKLPMPLYAYIKVAKNMTVCAFWTKCISVHKG